MTEVTSYPNPHNFGASSRGLLVPAPTPREYFFAPDIINNMPYPPPTSQSSYQSSYYGPSGQSLGARSSSVSSSSSSASYHAPSPISYQAYPSVYPPYSTYQAPSELISAYQNQPLVHTRDHYRPSIFGSASLQLSILQNIVSHLGYLDVIRLSLVNRWLYSHVDPEKVPEEEKIALMLRAEQEYRRYSLRTSAPSAPEVDHVGRDSGHLACYHCFRMKPPREFELFRYNLVDEGEDNETESSTPGQTPAPPPTSNPHYDPSITRSSLGKRTEKTNFDQSSPRIKETWGTRRFCIPCGVKKGFYKPGALIELRSEKPGGKERKGRKGDKEGKEAKWICNCYKIHKKPETLVCDGCNGLTPMSQNRGPAIERTSPYSSPYESGEYMLTANP
ncbi:hypothetical protein B0T14DRAFT_9424 [Immersiella caudata]|uniref:F-box domain-containing protein n=1 Tax=Immersiella caudata TaxID=314043 RepID=A0AA39XE58_9PEZI|nr:hypothetical protein B0T14DRAFT_9424 [Immersiella caudata]